MFAIVSIDLNFCFHRFSFELSRPRTNGELEAVLGAPLFQTSLSHQSVTNWSQSDTHLSIWSLCFGLF